MHPDDVSDETDAGNKELNAGGKWTETSWLAARALAAREAAMSLRERASELREDAERARDVGEC